MLQVAFREIHYILYGPIHDQCAAGEPPIHNALTVLQLHFEQSQLVISIGHACGGNGVGDEDDVLRPLGFE